MQVRTPTERSKKMKRRVMLLLATMAVALVVASGVTLAQSQVRRTPPRSATPTG